MLEFLSTYGIWIVFAAMFVFMIRMHGSGGGCCGGHQHSSSNKKVESEKEEQPVGAERHNPGCH